MGLIKSLAAFSRNMLQLKVRFLKLVLLIAIVFTVLATVVELERIGRNSLNLVTWWVLGMFLTVF